MKKIITIFALIILIVMSGCDATDDVWNFDENSHKIITKKYNSEKKYKYEYRISDTNDTSGRWNFILYSNQDFEIGKPIYITDIKPEKNI